MSKPQLLAPVRRLIEALVDCTDPGLRDRLLIEAALASGAARAAALWRRGEGGTWRAVLERGPEELLPTGRDLDAAEAGQPLVHDRRVLLARGGALPQALALGGVPLDDEEALDTVEAMLLAWSALGEEPSRPAGTAHPEADMLTTLPSVLPGTNHFADASGATSLTHDLRNLLSGIQTSMDVLGTCSESLDANELEQFERTVDRELARASSLLSSLFDARADRSTPSSPGAAEAVERDETSAGSGRGAACQPADVLEDLAQSEGARARAGGGALQVEVDPQARALRVPLAELQFDRIARNLIVNAREANPRGTVRVELLTAALPWAEPTPAAGATNGAAPQAGGLVLCVRDDGPGFPLTHSALRNGGFGERDERALDDHGPELGSTAPIASVKGAHRGRGLRIVQALVEGVGGRMRVRNLPLGLCSGGACIECWLPIAPASPGLQERAAPPR